MKPLLAFTFVLLFKNFYCDDGKIVRARRQDPWGAPAPPQAPSQSADPWAMGSQQGAGTGLDLNGGQQGSDLGQANGAQPGQGTDIGQTIGGQQGVDAGQTNGAQQGVDAGQANGGAAQETVDDGGQSTWGSLFNWFKSLGGHTSEDGDDDDDDYYDDLDNTNNSSTSNTSSITNTSATGFPASATTQNGNVWPNVGLWNTPTTQTTANNVNAAQPNNQQQNNWWNNNLWNPSGQSTSPPGIGGAPAQASSTTKSPWIWQDQGQPVVDSNNLFPPQQVPSASSTQNPNAIPWQQGVNNWQGPGAPIQGQVGASSSTPSPFQQGAIWQDPSLGSNSSPSVQGATGTIQDTTMSSGTTTTSSPCSLDKVSLGQSCSYVNPPPSGDEAMLTLRDVYQAIFDESVIEDLILVCPPGQWCLQDAKFFNPLQADNYDYFCNYTTCLEDASLTCSTDERTIVTSSLKSLCKQKEQNMTESCQMRMKMMLYVTMADMRRKQRDPNEEICGVQIASSDRCGDKAACNEEAKSFSCLTDQCLTEDTRQIWAQMPHWQWYFWDPVYMKQTCQITNTTECQEVLPTPAPQRYVFYVQFENMDGRVMTGLGTALVISLVGFIVAVWACVRKLSGGYTRDRVQYTEVKPEYFDAV